ncbi:hypothetical protein OPT61_g1400 [Boeremia exigua]|uniref:Uncharacterized protein n=1 Tax=Boeremia exigua TaxID=749465 RepID=A0ACC2IQI1_9PLEO|nr:hypothetical protein OPT61_g1400 [Boeremia exigua]
MPTETASISHLSERIADLTKRFANGSHIDVKLQQQIVVLAEKLAIATREPDENVYHTATQIAHNAALRSIIAMGVFEALPADETSISTQTLAAQLKVDKDLLGNSTLASDLCTTHTIDADRLMRALASTHFFLNPSPNHYAHTPLSRCYTTIAPRAMTAQMYDFTSQGVFALPRFLRGNNFSSAGTYTDGPFQLGAATNLGFWEYLGAEPERMALFSAGMRAGTTIGCGRASGAFPFGVALADCGEKDVAVVDIGGGRGQALEAIKKDWKGVRGRLVLQDLPHVVKDGAQKGLPAWMETSCASFFEPQSVIGARIYYFRRIFHDWDQVKGREILLNTKGAMNEYSRILITDMVLPDVDAPRDMALQDLNMMSFGGMERSEQQWRELVGSAGLVLRRVWLSKDGAKHAVVEVVLPEFQGVDVHETEGMRGAS